jgi:hypothetical protein
MDAYFVAQELMNLALGLVAGAIAAQHAGRPGGLRASVPTRLPR